MTRARFSEAEIAEALRKTGGIFTQAAQLLAKAEYDAGRHEPGRPAPSRQLIGLAVKRSKRLRDLLEEMTETTLDLAEGKLVQLLAAGDFHAVKFYLETKGRDRGYARRIEATGKNGGPIDVNNTGERDTVVVILPDNGHGPKPGEPA